MLRGRIRAAAAFALLLGLGAPVAPATGQENARPVAEHSGAALLTLPAAFPVGAGSTLGWAPAVDPDSIFGLAPPRALRLRRAPGAGPAVDPWLGSDKLRHFAVSYAATALAFAAARAAGLDRAPSLATAGVVAMGAGIGKELHDRGRAGETASLRDLAWDLLGVATGLAMGAATH